MERMMLAACSVVVIALCSVMVWAQATAQISGSVKDQSGAVLPGVELTATQTETGISRNTITNETGSYVLSNLALGPYRLQAGLPGFRTYAQSGIVLQVNGSPVINVILEVGQVTEQVEVQANAALVETRTSTVGTVIENARILELPLNGRQVTDLITLAGGAVQQSAGDIRFNSQGSPLLAVAGGSGFGVEFTLDGANHVNFMNASSMAMPFPDAMQEFKVESSGVSAQRGSPTAVSAVTKSGTNGFHGNLFEFVRNDLFNARNYFAAAHGTLKRNQFGGTFGGPIVKNKLFFFGGYQGTTLRQDPQDTRVFVPTATMLAGDWTTFTSPQCNAGRQITLRAPFVNNRIDPALFSKPALFIVNWRSGKPFPTTSDPCGQITYGSLSASNEMNTVVKVDYQKSAQHSLFGRVLFANHNDKNPDGFNSILLQNTGWITSLSSAYTFGSTYLIGSNMVQAFRLAVNRNATYYHNTGDLGTTKLFNWCDAGVRIYCPPENTRLYSTTISGAFNVTSSFLSPHRYVGNTYSLNDDVSLVRGNHQMAFGVGARQGRDNSVSTFVSPTQMNFTGGATGLGLADFLTGKIGTMLQGRTSTHHVNGTTIGVYATDSWKATSKVTLNYGVRWEPYIPQYAEAIYAFDHDRFLKGIKSSVYVNAPAGFYYRGDPGLPTNGINTSWLQFAPRAGFAWDVSGDGRTSVRASYSLGYVYVSGDFRETYSGAPPFGNRVNLSSPVGGLENPWLNVPGGNIFPYVLDKNAPFPANGQFLTQRPDTHVPYSQSWNFALQRQVGTAWLVSASYTGSNLIHVWTNQALNPAIYFPSATCTLNGVTYSPCSSAGNTDARRKLTLENPTEGAKIGYLSQLDDGGTQNYSGMVLSVERRAAKGITASANYTLSHCIGTYATLYAAMAMWASDTYADPNNRNLDRGSCDSDRRQIFNMTTVAETPQFANPTVRMLATGWRLSGIYRRSSGSPLTILSGSDRALNGSQVNASGTPVQRGNQVLGNPFKDTSGGPLTSYLNPLAFAIPDLGTMGNAGRNSIRGVTTWAFDIGLSRVFRLRETQRVEFRAEAFNITNSFRPVNPNATVNNANFGVIRAAQDPRILQFALKYVF